MFRNDFSPFLLEKSEKVSHYIAFFLTSFLLFGILIKIKKWDYFIEFLNSMVIFKSIPGNYVKIVGFTFILLEVILAIGILFRSTRPFASVISFLILNIIIIIFNTDMGLTNIPKIALNFHPLQLFIINFVNIILAVSALFLFFTRKMSQKGIKNFVLSLIIYLTLSGVFIAEDIFKQSDVNTNLKQFKQLSFYFQIPRENSTFLLTFINLSNLSCSLCSKSINEFLSFIESDSSLSNHLILITHPDSLYGKRRVEGWTTAVHLINDYRFIPARKALNFNLKNSCVLVFNSDNNVIENVQFPFAVKKEMEKIKELF